MPDRKAFTRQADGLAERGFDAPPSPMAQMMLSVAGAALAGGKCEDALEHVLAVSSIEEHPDITVALAVTALEVAGLLDLDVRPNEVRLRLLHRLAVVGHEKAGFDAVIASLD